MASFCPACEASIAADALGCATCGMSFAVDAVPTPLDSQAVQPEPAARAGTFRTPSPPARVTPSRHTPSRHTPPRSAPPGADPYLGAVIDGKYRIDTLVGAGGMGRVYKATHLGLDKTVCVKLLKPQLLNDDTIVGRFEREAKAASRLDHPNSIDVKDFGQDENGHLYLVMEYVPGRDLRRILREEFPLPAERVVRIVAQVLSALARAHAMGVIHRDLKPENILVADRPDEPDFVKVVDFGIAKLQDAEAKGLTQADMVCGTPEYMSPEQAMGRTLDARADLYAIGAILHQCFAGRPPFEGASSLEVLQKQLGEPPAPVTDANPDAKCPAAIEALILRALAKEPGLRPPNAETFRRDLLAAVGLTSLTPQAPASRPRPAATVEDLEAPPPPPSSAPKWIAVMAVLALVAAGAWRWSKAPTAPPEEPQDAGTAEVAGDAGTFLTRETALEAMGAHGDDLRDCILAAAKKKKGADTAGELVLSISIGEGGKVKEANVSENTVRLPKLEACVEAKARAWTFAPPERPPMMLSYPYRFRRQH